MRMRMQEIRTEFEPAVSRWTYLNAAACGLTPCFAREAMNTWWEDKLQNGSVHYHTWEDFARRTKGKFGKLINARSEELAYMMNTSEGLNLIINGIDFKKGDNVVVNRYDFPSNYLPWLNLQASGVEVRCVDVAENRIPVESVESLVDRNTRAVSLSSVQFKSGFRCNLKEIGTICKENESFFVVDAVQSLGAYEMDVKKYGIDALCTSCYKWLLGPDGIGFLYCSEDIVDEIATTNIGWMSTPDPWSFPAELELERTSQKFESGTLPWPLIYSIDPIFDFFNDITVRTVQNHISSLLDYLIEELTRLNVKIISPLQQDERSGILTFDVRKREKLAAIYQNEKVRISVRDGIRVSPHIYNTISDMQKLIAILEKFLGG
jgi:cysteine desulfurase/selenocysteine lyase